MRKLSLTVAVFGLQPRRSKKRPQSSRFQGLHDGKNGEEVSDARDEVPESKNHILRSILDKVA